jgi:hypothetical protein
MNLVMNLVGILLPTSILGFLQWRYSHGLIRWPTAWIAVSALALPLAGFFEVRYQLFDLYIGSNFELDSAMYGPAFGAVFGLVQWLLLRQWARQAYWWILANMIGWTASVTLDAFIPWSEGNYLRVSITLGLYILFVGSVTIYTLSRLKPIGAGLPSAGP